MQHNTCKWIKKTVRSPELVVLVLEASNPDAHLLGKILLGIGHHDDTPEQQIKTSLRY